MAPSTVEAGPGRVIRPPVHIVCHPARTLLADAVPYTGHTIEHRRVVVDVAGRSVVAVRVGIARYRCETFGEIGPLVVRSLSMHWSMMRTLWRISIMRITWRS